MIRRQGPIKVMIVDDLPIAAVALSLALSSSKRDTRFALSGVERCISRPTGHRT
jgi:hypothetical protein